MKKPDLCHAQGDKIWTGIWDICCLQCNRASRPLSELTKKNLNKLNFQFQGEDEDVRHVISAENTLGVKRVCGSPFGGTESWHTCQMWNKVSDSDAFQPHTHQWPPGKDSDSVLRNEME